MWQPGVAFDVGGLFVIGACVCWGIDNSVTARIDQLSPEQITFTKGAVAGTVNVVLGLAIASAAGIEARQIVAALAIGALGYGASITLWVKGARDLGAARGQIIFATAPFIGAVVSWTVLHESISLVQLLAVPHHDHGHAGAPADRHTHRHHHDPVEHVHDHVPDLHHRHAH